MPEFKNAALSSKLFAHLSCATHSEVVYLKGDETGSVDDAEGKIVIRIDKPR